LKIEGRARKLGSRTEKSTAAAEALSSAAAAEISVKAAAARVEEIKAQQASSSSCSTQQQLQPELPRSRIGPYNYESVVGEILIREAEREIKDMVAMQAITPPVMADDHEVVRRSCSPTEELDGETFRKVNKRLSISQTSGTTIYVPAHADMPTIKDIDLSDIVISPTEPIEIVSAEAGTNLEDTSLKMLNRISQKCSTPTPTQLLKMFNSISQKCSTPTCTDVAEHVCAVCQDDGFCASCYQANRKIIRLYGRNLTICDLCKKPHHSRCGENVRSGEGMKSRCDPCNQLWHGDRFGITW
jgi:hypothetical protein